MAENPKSGFTKGGILKEAREAKGISLETVQDAVKIPMDVLRAIEEGYTVRTLSPFYLKGFVKMYAQYLHVDPAQVLEDYHTEKVPKPARISAKMDEDPSVKFDKVFTKKRQQQVVVVGFVIIGIFLAGKVIGGVMKKSPEKKTSVKASVSAPAKKKGKLAKTLVPKKESVKKAPAEEKLKPVEKAAAVVKEEPPAEVSEPKDSILVAEEGDAKTLNLTVRAKKRVWLQVKVDGNLVFQSNLKEGVAETWQAQDDIELSGKNITALEFELNGKVLGGLGGSDRDARRVMITKQGLTVKQ